MRSNIRTILALTLSLGMVTQGFSAGVREKQLDSTYTSEVVKRDGSVAFTGNVDAGSNKLVNLTAGTAATDAVNKAQLDAIAAGTLAKSPTRAHLEDTVLASNASVASGTAYDSTAGTSTRGQITATLSVSGTFTVDGVAMVAGDRLLVSSEGLGTAEVMSVDTVADTAGSLNNDYWVFYTNASTAYYVWYNVASGGTDPTPSPPAGVSYTAIEVAIATNATNAAVASATDAAIVASGVEVGVSTVTNAMTLTNDFGGNVTDVVEGVGTGFTFGTDTPGTGLGADANGIYTVGISGTALTLDRATDFDEDAEVVSGALAYNRDGTTHAGHQHILSTVDPVTIGGAGGTSQTWVMFFSTALADNAPTSVDAGDAGVVGVSGQAAREDHQHAVSTAAASSLTPDLANSEGTSTSLARADHIHNVAAAVVNSISAATTVAGEGTAASFARSDHTHGITVGAPTASIDAGDAAAEGTSTSFVRLDHQHAVSTGPASAAAPGDTNSEGTSTNLARADHTHAHPTGSAVNVGTANATGSSGNFADAGHVHDSPQPTDADKNVTASATTGTNQATGLTITNTPALASYLKPFANGVLYTMGDGVDTAEFYMSGDACTTPRALTAVTSGDVMCQGDALSWNLDTTDRLSLDYLTFVNN